MSSCEKLLLSANDFHVKSVGRRTDMELQIGTETFRIIRKKSGMWSWCEYSIQMGDTDNDVILLHDGKRKKRPAIICDTYHSGMQTVEYPPGTPVCFTRQRYGSKNPAVQGLETGTWYEAMLTVPKRGDKQEPILRARLSCMGAFCRQF